MITEYDDLDANKKVIICLPKLLEELQQINKELRDIKSVLIDILWSK